MKPQVEIYDTTLRDGSQGEGINFSVADKLRIAEKLDSFGVHYIEGGWPGSNPKDIEFFAQAKKKKFKNARLAAFGSTRKKGVPVEKDDQVRLLIEAGTPVVTIYGKTSMLHVKEVLRCSPEENLGMIGDTVRYLKDHGKFVIYDAEHCFDGYKLDPEYAIATWQAAEKAGADFVVLCDTNGGCLPGEVAAITKTALGKLNCKVGIHTHDDIGLGAAANAIAALRATREIPGQLRIISFDNTREPLEFALKNAAALGYLAGYENQIAGLLRDQRVEFENGKLKVNWEFSGAACPRVGPPIAGSASFWERIPAGRTGVRRSTARDFPRRVFAGEKSGDVDAAAV